MTTLGFNDLMRKRVLERERERERDEFSKGRRQEKNMTLKRNSLFYNIAPKT